MTQPISTLGQASTRIALIDFLIDTVTIAMLLCLTIYAFQLKFDDYFYS